MIKKKKKAEDRRQITFKQLKTTRSPIALKMALELAEKQLGFLESKKIDKKSNITLTTSCLSEPS